MSGTKEKTPRPIDALRASLTAQATTVIPSPQEQRTRFEAMAALLPPKHDVAHESVTIAGVACEWVSVPEVRADHVVLTVHGGGYVAGSLVTHRGFNGEIARATNSRVLAIDYGLAPEHPFPSGRDDVAAVWRAMSHQAERLAIVADSAGGGLALSAALHLRDASSLPAGPIVLCSPWADLTNSSNSFSGKAAVDPMIRPRVLDQFAADYAGDVARDDPSLSPVHASLHGLPPMLIQLGSDEVLLDDALTIDRSARKAGVDVTLEVWPEMIHAFQVYHLLLPEGRAAIERIGRFIVTSWHPEEIGYEN